MGLTSMPWYLRGIGSYATAAPPGGPALDAVTEGAPGSSVPSITDSHTIGAISNGLLLAFIAHRRDGTQDIGTSTWNGTEALTFVAQQIIGDSVIEVWRRIAPTTGTHDLVSTIAGSFNSDIIQHIYSISGAHQTTPLGTPAQATGTVSPITVTVGSVGATDLVVDGFTAEDGGSGYAVGANQTLRSLDTTASSSMHTGTSTQSGADGGVMSWTATGIELWAQIAVAVKPV